MAGNQMGDETMTPTALRAAARELYGPVNDATIMRHLSVALKVCPRTVGKWWYGERKIPGPAEVAIGLLIAALR